MQSRTPRKFDISSYESSTICLVKSIQTLEPFPSHISGRGHKSWRKTISKIPFNSAQTASTKSPQTPRSNFPFSSRCIFLFWPPKSKLLEASLFFLANLVQDSLAKWIMYDISEVIFHLFLWSSSLTICVFLCRITLLLQKDTFPRY